MLNVPKLKHVGFTLARCTWDTHLFYVNNMICLYMYATLYIHFTLIISFKNFKINSTQVLLFHDVIYFDIYLYSNLKGFDVAEGGGIELISSIVTNTLSIPCNVLMGANLAGEIADGKFSETTIGI